jgi:hypothetical protein
MVISKACAALLMAFSKTLLIADVRSLLGSLDAGAADRERPAIQVRYAGIADPTLRQIKFKAEAKQGRGARGVSLCFVPISFRGVRPESIAPRQTSTSRGDAFRDRVHANRFPGET